MLSLEEAQAAIMQAVTAATTTETVGLHQAHGRYLAQAVQARVDNPAFDNSAMDGYALRLADLVGDAPVLPVVGESSAGNAPGQHTPGSAMRIFTGAPLPAGADAVIMQEEVERDGQQARFSRPVKAGQNVRRQGEDFQTGQALYQPGRRLSAFDLALLSSAGLPELPVYRRPRALVVATGSELVSPGEPLKPGQIYESNRLATLLQLEALGVEAVDGGMVRDEAKAVRTMLERATDYDFVITSGGVSVGDHDLVKKLFAEIGEINFWRVKIKPGKPLAFGRVGDRTHFFGLPGNPVSSLVTFKLFVEPAVAAWHHAAFRPLQATARAANAFKRQAGRTEFVRGRMAVENGALNVTALKGQGSHQLGTLRDTNCLIRVEGDSEGFDEGAALTVLPLQLML